MEWKNFLLVDDEAAMRHGLRSLLQTETFVKHIYEAQDRTELLTALSKEIDIVLLDIKLRGTHGLELIPVIKEKSKYIKIIVVTGMEGKELISNLMSAGVQSIIYKIDGYDEIRKAILTAMKGKRYFPQRTLEVVLESKSQPKNAIPVISKFKKIDYEILRHVADGMTSKEIAENCKMSAESVETYRARLLRKAKVSNTAGLLAFAYKNGLL